MIGSRRLAVAALVGLIATALAEPRAEGSAEVRQTTPLVLCGEVDIGFTDADVYAGGGASCAEAFAVHKSWRQKAKRACKDGRCKKLAIGEYRCLFGGSDVLLKLRCTSGTKVVRVTWGG